MDELRTFWLTFSRARLPRHYAPQIRDLVRQAFYAGATASLASLDQAAQADDTGKTFGERMEALRLETRAYANQINRPPA